MTTSRSSLERTHECGVPGCHRRIKAFYFACLQHRQLLGFDLSVRLQTAWIERRWNTGFEEVKAEALRKWGWKPETPCSNPSSARPSCPP